MIDVTALLIEAYQLLDSAQVEDGMGKRDVAIEYLVILRERLNSEPELEAGGAPQTCRKCGCTDLAACPDGCYWVKPDLCSNCVVLNTNGTVSRRPSKTNHKA